MRREGASRLELVQVARVNIVAAFTISGNILLRVYDLDTVHGRRRWGLGLYVCVSGVVR